MIILDTNVLSEAMRPIPTLKVLEWMRGAPLETLYTTAITEAELRYGIALMPQGRRRRQLDTLVTQILEEDFEGRILPFDQAAAGAYADIAASRRRAGRPISEPDARIAAIAISLQATMATRNTGDFSGCGIQLINPWL